MTAITKNGKTYTLQQDAYITQGGTPTRCWYEAHAKDEHDNDFKVKWNIIDSETENEDEACDWDEFEIVKA